MQKILPWIDQLLYPLCVLLAVLYGPRDRLWAIALGLSAAAAVLWFIARRQLGKSFSVDPQACQLVTHGLYSKFRHPIYLFGDLAYFGALLALRSWLGYLAWLYIALVDISRARREERLLAEAFGKEYLAYKQKTWF